MKKNKLISLLCLCFLVNQNAFSSTEFTQMTFASLDKNDSITLTKDQLIDLIRSSVRDSLLEKDIDRNAKFTVDEVFDLILMEDIEHRINLRKTQEDTMRLGTQDWTSNRNI